MRVCSAILGLLLLAAASGSAAAEEDVDLNLNECRDQLEAFARLDLDCEVQASVAEQGLARVPETLRPMLAGLSCHTRVAAQKSEIYGDWIVTDRFDPPRTRVVCNYDEAASQPLVATVDIGCTRHGEAWSCPPAVEGIEGAGPLGKVLTRYLNQDSGLWQGLERELARRD